MTERRARFAAARHALARAAWAVFACLAAVVPPAFAQAPDASAIKADMVCNMAKFVQWPEGVIAQNRGQIVVAILGEDDLAVTLASVLSARTVNGKPLFVRFARRAQDCKGAQIVYVAGSESAHVDEILTAFRGAPVVTLSDLEGFAQRGGMVNFTGAPPRVRFEISLQRAEQAGLRISSRLLALAHVVDGAP
ncbi:MAG: YfiR family protein [Candidatus Eisenbacteria bacterium]